MVVVVAVTVASMASCLRHSECYRADGTGSGMKGRREFYRGVRGKDAPLSRSTEIGDPEERVEGGTKPAPQGLRQRHHGPGWMSRHASTGERAEWTGCSLRSLHGSKQLRISRGI